MADRDLLQGPTGQRATDTEIEAGQFQVVAIAGEEKSWVVLDASPDHINLVEG